MMRFIHNEKIALGWAVLIEIVVHALIASQAFLLGSFLGEVALTVLFGAVLGPIIGAWFLAVVIFGAAMQAFVFGEYLKEHTVSYERSGKDGSFIRSYKQIRRLVASMELTSLAFRMVVVWQGGNALSAVILGALGIVLLWYAYAQAKVIHASVNRPIEYRMAQAQYEVSTSFANDVLKYKDSMSPEEKARFAGGDYTAINNAAQTGFFADQQRQQTKNEKRQSKATRQLIEQQREDTERAQQQDAKRNTNNFFNPANWGRRNNDGPKPAPLTVPFSQAQSQTGQPLSRNGHQ